MEWPGPEGRRRRRRKGRRGSRAEVEEKVVMEKKRKRWEKRTRRMRERRWTEVALTPSLQLTRTTAGRQQDGGGMEGFIEVTKRWTGREED